MAGAMGKPDPRGQKRPDLTATIARIGSWRMNGWHALVVIIILASALRLAGLGHRSFFGDEILTLNASKRGLLTDPSLTGPPQWHPPLHYSVHHLAWRLGACSEFGWRIPGVLFGVLLAVATFLTALYAGALRTSLLAGLFVAVSPLSVLFSQSARWHPIAGGLLGIGCACAAYAVSRRSLWAWGLASLFLAMASHIVYLAIAVTAIISLVLLGFVLMRHKSVRGWLVYALVYVLAIAPISGMVLSAVDKQTVTSGIVRSALSFGGKALLLLENLTAGPTVLPWNWPVMVISALAFIPPIYFFFSARNGELDDIRVPLTAFFVICAAAAITVPVASHPRYWLVLLLPTGIAVAGGIVHAHPRWLRTVFITLICGVFAYGLFNLYTNRQYQYLEFTDSWREIIRDAKTVAEPEDTVLTLATPFAHYYGPGARVVVGQIYPPEALKRLVGGIDSERVIVQYSPLSGWEHINFSGLAERLGEALRGRGYRLEWIRRYGHDPDADIKRRYLAGRSFPDYRHRLALYTRNNDGPTNESPAPDR